MSASTQPSARNDLYRHINGEWLDSHEIPADQGAYGAFMELRDAAEEAVHGLATDAAAALAENRTGADGVSDTEAFTASNDDVSATARIGALYTAFMDTTRIERRGLEPIIGDIAQIESVGSIEELLELSGSLQRRGVSGLIATGSMNDAGNPERMLLHLLQDGLGLPDESYYREEKFADLVEDYRGYVANMFGLAGIGGDPQQTRADAEAVVDLETKIAAVHWDVVACRDAVKRYNLMTREQLLEAFPLAETWLSGVGATGERSNRSDEVVVWQPDFLQGIQSLLTEQSLATWKLWLHLQLVRSAAPYLTEGFVNENFEFYGRQLSGTEEVRPRWKRAVSFVNGAVGEDVGRIYVARHFPEGHKAQMDELVSTLLEAYRRSISALDWMGEETRQRALEKLAMFNPMVGYPVKWIDYSSLTVDPTDLMASMYAAAEFEFERDLAKIETGPDPEEWHMTPQMVNAYYSPMENTIVFPAAILQPPFFDPEASAAQNFGGIGAVIGHEIGHGFDDQGSQYAGDGTLRNWWTDEDREAFSSRTTKLVDQYAELAPDVAPDHSVNGELTLGENIGDLGGLGIAHQALNIYLEEHAGTERTPETDREFFASWATVWRQLTRKETMITRITSDPHSPNEFRCNQVVKNLHAFHQAYDTEPGDAMWLDEDQRVTIW